MPVETQVMPSTAAGMSRFDLFLQHWRAKILLFVGLRPLARNVFLGILEKSPQDQLALNSMAYDAMQASDWVQALNYFEKVLALSPDKSNAHFYHAFVSEELGRLEDAERGFLAAIAIEEKMDRAWYGLGLVLIRQGRLEDALAALKRNTQLQPMSPFGWYQLARVHVDLKQTHEALKVIRHLKGFEPKVAAQLERETGLSVGQLI
jgi:tetratricopeptide (TPR) repeat protein